MRRDSQIGPGENKNKTAENDILRADSGKED